LRELEALCDRVGVLVRSERFAPNATRRGGLCVLRGQRIVVLDETLPLLDKIFVLTEALRALGVEALYVPAHLRARLPATPRTPHGWSHRYRPLARAVRTHAPDPSREPSGER
jgi:hypothetical protein